MALATAPSASRPPSTLVGFGASSMQGVGDSQGGFLARVAAHCQSRALPVTVINKGIGGQSSPAMLARTGELTALRPYDLVVILGCNDLPRARDRNPAARTSFDTYTDNLRRLLAALPGGGRSLFISSFAVSEKHTGIAPALFSDYLNAATDIARAQRYDIWDLFNETRAGTAPLLAADGLHFNDTGHALIASRVLDWLLTPAANTPAA